MNNSESILAGKSIDRIVAEIESEVAVRRVAGDYPVGLEQQLEALFQAMMRDLHERDVVSAGLREAIAKTGQIVQGFSVEVSSSSRFPGLAFLHRVFSRLVRRHTENLAAQVVQLGESVLDSLTEVSELANRIYEHDDRHIARTLTAVQDQLAVVEHLSQLTVEIEGRLRTLEDRES